MWGGGWGVFCAEFTLFRFGSNVKNCERGNEPFSSYIWGSFWPAKQLSAVKDDCSVKLQMCNSTRVWGLGGHVVYICSFLKSNFESKETEFACVKVWDWNVLIILLWCLWVTVVIDCGWWTERCVLSVHFMMVCRSCHILALFVF